MPVDPRVTPLVPMHDRFTSEREMLAHARRLLIAELHHRVQEPVVQQKLAALKTGRQLLTNGLLDHSGTRETDQRSRLSDVQISQHRETGGHAAGGRIGQHADEGQALLV